MFILATCPLCGCNSCEEEKTKALSLVCFAVVWFGFWLLMYFGLDSWMLGCLVFQRFGGSLFVCLSASRTVSKWTRLFFLEREREGEEVETFDWRRVRFLTFARLVCGDSAMCFSIEVGSKNGPCEVQKQILLTGPY